MWLLYALLSAIFASFKKVNDKHLSHSVNHWQLSWMLKLSTLPVIGVTALLMQQIVPKSSMCLVVWGCILLSALVVTPIDTALYLKTLKYGKLSVTAPLHSLYPVITIVTGAIFLNQIPSFSATFGILVIVFGIYILNTSKSNKNVFNNLWSSKGTKYGILGLFTVTANTTISAVGISKSSGIFYAFWAVLITTLVQFVYAQIIAPGEYKYANKKLLAQNGIIQGTSSVFYFSAIASGPLAYVTAIRSLSSTFSALLGARAFKEGLGKRKLASYGLITLGAILIALQA